MVESPGEEISPLATFITNTLGLTKLPPYLSTFSYALLSFTFLHRVLAPWASNKLFPVAYSSKDTRTQNSWTVHVTSQVHAVIVVPFALWVIWNENPGMDRAFGWSSEIGHVHAIACGYFLWDTIDAAICFSDLGFLAHGVACFAIYTLSYKPFLAYYGIRCLLWETSTIFLNIHWFLDKTGRTGGKAQLINGFLLLSTFFTVRLVYGAKISYDFYHTLIQVRNEIPWFYLFVYGCGNITLTSLNWFWFYRVIFAFKRRFSGDMPKEHSKLVDVSYANGHSQTPRPLSGNGNTASTRSGYGTQT